MGRLTISVTSAGSKLLTVALFVPSLCSCSALTDVLSDSCRAALLCSGAKRRWACLAGIQFVSSVSLALCWSSVSFRLRALNHWPSGADHRNKQETEQEAFWCWCRATRLV